MITLIAAMGKNNEIGEDNKLLWDLPEDMKHFRTRTKEKIVVMGRKTFESIGHPLPKRRNIILSRNPNYSPEGVEVFSDIQKIIELSKSQEVMIIGGEMIYILFLPFATHLSLTFVDAEFPNADAFFPIYENGEWNVISLNKYPKNDTHQFGFKICEMERK